VANKIRVVVVDDNRDILCSVGQILEARGYKVYLFDNGRDCIKYLNETKKPPSLIILDIMMPEISGWEIHRRIQEMKNLSHVPILFLTARSNSTALDMYDRYGVEYIIKPFDVKNLQENIERIITAREEIVRTKKKYGFFTKPECKTVAV